VFVSSSGRSDRGPQDAIFVFECSARIRPPVRHNRTVFDWIALAGFSIATAAALSVDVCLYSIARFGAGHDAGSAFRFGNEVGIAHCVLLVLGAGSAIVLGNTLGSDAIVDALSVLALGYVLWGAFHRARAGLTITPSDEPSRSLSWFTAFALSIDGFLVGPAIDELVAPRGNFARVFVLGLMFLTITALATTLAATSRRLRERLLRNRRDGAVDPGPLAFASAAELCVFTVFVTDGVVRLVAHLKPSISCDPLLARFGGAVVGLLLFFVARRIGPVVVTS
jgi:hypothetical protein